MRDRELVEKRLSVIEACLGDLRRLARPEMIASDVREERFVEHTLQLAIQAALDVASRIVSERRLGEPRSNRELFTLLARDGWIEAALQERLASMAGFRNILVHAYEDVDLAIVADVLATRLGDLVTFVAAVRRNLASDPDGA
jgi:uncharacterized protein YutE (UPF0331/DUF86 family)